MKIKKNISQCLYDGMIGEEHLLFRRAGRLLSHCENILIVEKPDGQIIEYIDSHNNDLILDYLLITKNGKMMWYSSDCKVGRKIINDAQKNFDGYLKAIKDTKIKQGLENIK